MELVHGYSFSGWFCKIDYHCPHFPDPNLVFTELFLTGLSHLSPKLETLGLHSSADSVLGPSFKPSTLHLQHLTADSVKPRRFQFFTVFLSVGLWRQLRSPLGCQQA